MSQHPDAGPALSVHLLRDLQDAIGEATSALAHRLRMSATDAAALEHVALADEALGPGELGARLAVTRSSATEVVDRLARAGHVERVRDEADRRRYRLEPTATARSRVRAELDPLRRSLDSAADGFSPAQQQVIATYLRAVTSAYRSYAATPDDAPGSPRSRR
ncbi:MarR family winged helix-turn-helix transcriptional regulator [Cellulosimicrobium protaetiae]|uniref:MarR family transcriptional regulator n=1 Tax=Cellulosimicrobium protaetiae TaxID=2587808 RepID=A0A6M5UKR6_9MICO|nr:MarR family transcriptional regulator [Cellulosimicrobium protaetiae]QJW37698.1 MarR family transcriptional regulator [Cellulosimicrobium protaetiae]